MGDGEAEGLVEGDGVGKVADGDAEVVERNLGTDLGRSLTVAARIVAAGIVVARMESIAATSSGMPLPSVATVRMTGQAKPSA